MELQLHRLIPSNLSLYAYVQSDLDGYQSLGISYETMQEHSIPNKMSTRLYPWAMSRRQLGKLAFPDTKRKKEKSGSKQTFQNATCSILYFASHIKFLRELILRS